MAFSVVDTSRQDDARPPPPQASATERLPVLLIGLVKTVPPVCPVQPDLTGPGSLGRSLDFATLTQERQAVGHLAVPE
jgi:hypothetical protein